MAEAILVPQVGQDLTEATVVELHVKLGDTVKKGDLVAVVESEKASFEVEAFAEGVVIDLPYKEGDIATVLEPLMHVGEPGETVPAEAPAAAAPAVEPAAEAPAQAPVVETAQAAQPSGILRASPVARRIASEQGCDITLMTGTGPMGAVVLRDVEAALSAGPAVAGLGAGRIELRTLQSGSGSPVIFLHGFGADLSAWRPTVGQLGLGLTMMALDLPGHGGSAGCDAPDFAAITDAVGQALHALGGGIHLVGHSLGAAVATALTGRGDLDIRSLTLISPAGLGASIDTEFVEGFLAAESEAALTAWMRRLVHDPADLAPVLVRATQAAREQSGLVAAQRNVARGLFEHGTQLFSVAERLRRYQGVCTVIAGCEDAIVSYRDIAAQVPPQAALHRLPGVGHLPQIEAADLVNRLITRTVRAAG